MKWLQHRLEANPTTKIPKTIKVNESFMTNATFNLRCLAISKDHLKMVPNAPFLYPL